MKGKLINGKRISIGPVKLSDARHLAQYFNETKHYLGAVSAKDMTISSEKDYIKKANQADDLYYFGIRLIHSGEIIGTMSVTGIDKHNGIAETGAMIGEAFTGQGYGTEAKHLLLDFAFNQLKLRKLYSNVHGFNERSRAYSLRCGYVQEATLPEYMLWNGKYWYKWILSINKEQWEEKYNMYKKEYLL